MKRVIGYKIFNPKTLLYSRGGGKPRWNSIGKTWNTLNALKSHFAVVREFGRYAERRTGMAEKPGYDRNWNVKKEYGDCRIITVVADENFLLEKFL